MRCEILLIGADFEHRGGSRWKQYQQPLEAGGHSERDGSETPGKERSPDNTLSLAQ